MGGEKHNKPYEILAMFTNWQNKMYNTLLTDFRTS